MDADRDSERYPKNDRVHCRVKPWMKHREHRQQSSLTKFKKELVLFLKKNKSKNKTKNKNSLEKETAQIKKDCINNGSN